MTDLLRLGRSELLETIEAQRAQIAKLVEGNQKLAANHALMLENLSSVQGRCTELLDENRGWRTAFTRRIDSEIPKDFVWPVRFVEPGCGTLRTLADVIAERWRQDAKWGRAFNRIDIPDGTGGFPLFDAEAYAAAAKEACDMAFAGGRGSFRHILAEEFAEVVAESDPVKLRAELVQVAAVACLWCEVIDLRAKRSP